VSALKLSDAVRLPEVRHNRALEAPALKMVLCAMTMNGRPLTRLAMRLLMLTSVRTAELRGATWKEFDLEKREWTIAGQRMKMKRPHLIPLSVQAVEVLRKVEALNPKHKSDDFLFPHTKDATKTMSAGTINAVFK
jgi:integrase